MGIWKCPSPLRHAHNCQKTSGHLWWGWSSWEGKLRRIPNSRMTTLRSLTVSLKMEMQRELTTNPMQETLGIFLTKEYITLKSQKKNWVVFDYSTKYDGTGLKDHLLTGPDLTIRLTGVLCRFRKHPIAVICDVEKMFHRFCVSPEDREYLHFLW